MNKETKAIVLDILEVTASMVIIGVMIAAFLGVACLHIGK